MDIQVNTIKRILAIVALLGATCKPPCVKAADDDVDYYDVKKELIGALMHGYDPAIKPFKHKEDKNEHPFNVYMLVSLFSMMGIDEHEEAMTTSMLFTLLWIDQKMVWDPADYHNVTEIHVKAGQVWKPVWFILNAIDRESVIAFDDWVPIHYKHDGQALWQQMGTIKTSCDIDTTYFPFDKQTCSMTLHFYEFNINLTILNKGNHLKYYTGNGMWELLEYDMTSQRTFPVFNLTYTFQRKPDFNLFNVLLPVVLVDLIGPLVFLLPAESGERIGYSVTVLLTVSVYLTIVSESLPHSSDPMSLLTYMLFSLYTFCTLIVVVVVMTTKLYLYGASTPVPRVFIRVFGCRKLCKKSLVRMRKATPLKVLRLKNVDKSVAPNGNETRKLSKRKDVEINGNQSTDSDADDAQGENQMITPLSEVNWQDIAKALDRVALYGFYLLKIVSIMLYVFLFK